MRRRIGLLLLLVVLAVTGCQEPGTSKTPTAYMEVGVDGAGKQGITHYLTTEHPQVRSAEQLAKEFLEIYLNQDYTNLTLEQTRPLWHTGSFGTNPVDSEIKNYLRDEKAIKLVSMKIRGMSFASGGSNRFNSGWVDVDAVVQYRHLTTRAAGAPELNKDTVIAIRLDLMKREDEWQVRGIQQSIPQPVK